MKRKMWKQFIAVVLTVIMCVEVVPLEVWASEAVEVSDTEVEESKNEADVNKAEVADTESEEGTTEVVTTSEETTVCDEEIERNTVNIPVADHNYKQTVTKATTAKNGKIVTNCQDCGHVKSTSTIYKISSVKLSKTSYVYNGKVKKPAVTVKNSAGKTISSSYYTVTYATGRKNAGKYKVTVKFKTRYTGAVVKTFTIVPKGTSISSLSKAKKSLTVKWKKQTTQTNGYQIQYSTSKKFSSNVKSATVSGNKTTSKKITGLKAQKTYYVRIRTYKTVKYDGKNIKLYSGWSTVKSVKTK